MLYRDLSAPAKIVYHITRRVKNHQTESFFHAIETIARLAGISECSTRRGLEDLVRKGILKRTERPGHSTLYTFIQTADLALFDTPLLPNLIPHPSQIDTHNNSDLTNSDLTTTVWLTEKLSNTLVAKYGPQAVSDRVVVISKMNGKIRNKAGLLVASLKGNYIPASKELREKEKKENQSKWIDEKIKKEKKESEEMKKLYEQSTLTSGQIKEMFDQVGKEN